MRIAPLSAAGVPLLQRALREPLLHFLLLGGLLFGAYAVLPGEPTADQQRVVDPRRGLAASADGRRAGGPGARLCA